MILKTVPEIIKSDLVRELIPYLEQRFRLIPEASARYVTGASSGGFVMK